MTWWDESIDASAPIPARRPVAEPPAVPAELPALVEFSRASARSLDHVSSWRAVTAYARDHWLDDADGVPDSRTLLLKDVDERGWAFAGTASSRKAAQLTANPAAALSLWWQPQMRAIRVRGPVVQASHAECEADLAARSPQARATVPPGEWRVWRVQPERIEYWQGSPDRQHIRIIYGRDGDGWTRTVDRGENAR